MSFGQVSEMRLKASIGGILRERGQRSARSHGRRPDIDTWRRASTQLKLQPPALGNSGGRDSQNEKQSLARER